MMRKIIHIDMDAFFAAVEQRNHPELKGQPIAVGYDGPRGVVCTASYEARRFGVRSAMPIMRAKQLCPQLIIVPHHGKDYKEASMQVHDIFSTYTDQIEPLSIDEAFLDVTENKSGISLAKDIAIEIKQRIFEKTRLTASAGISYNKFLAKIASDYHKPNGLFVIHPDKALAFIGKLPIESFWGVGPKTANRMHKMGIFTGAQLRMVSEQHLNSVFGKMGKVYYDYARGVDERPVIVDWTRKSVGCEHTFLEDITQKYALLIELYHTVLELVDRIARADFDGKTLTLKIKFFDFTQITRSLTAHHDLKTKKDILPLAKKLLNEVDYHRRPVRLLGLSVSNPHIDANTAVWKEGWLDGFRI